MHARAKKSSRESLLGKGSTSGLCRCDSIPSFAQNGYLPPLSLCSIQARLGIRGGGAGGAVMLKQGRSLVMIGHGLHMLTA